MRTWSTVVLQVVLVLGLTLPVLSVAQEEPPVLVFISWDGSPSWLIEQLLDDGRLPNLARLAERGVYVKHTVGNWPSLTAAGHAVAFTGAFGNVSGITGNGVPLAPFSEHPIGAGTTSGFSADNLLAEPIWITAARQGRSSAMISVTQSSPFEMYTAEDYVLPQGAPAFGDFSEELLIVDPYATISIGANVVSGQPARARVARERRVWLVRAARGGTLPRVHAGRRGWDARRHPLRR